MQSEEKPPSPSQHTTARLSPNPTAPHNKFPELPNHPRLLFYTHIFDFLSLCYPFFRQLYPTFPQLATSPLSFMHIFNFLSPRHPFFYNISILILLPFLNSVRHARNAIHCQHPSMSAHRQIHSASTFIDEPSLTNLHWRTLHSLHPCPLKHYPSRYRPIPHLKIILNMYTPLIPQYVLPPLQVLLLIVHIHPRMSMSMLTLPILFLNRNCQRLSLKPLFSFEPWGRSTPSIW